MPDCFVWTVPSCTGYKRRDMQVPLKRNGGDASSLRRMRYDTQDYVYLSRW
jgi:hypothetical protein